MRLAPQKRRPASARRSRGGLSTKIHTTVDALGNPFHWIVTGSEGADITQAHAPVEGLNTQAVIGDKSYDADALVARFFNRLKQFRRMARTMINWCATSCPCPPSCVPYIWLA
jgi:transposase